MVKLKSASSSENNELSPCLHGENKSPSGSHYRRSSISHSPLQSLDMNHSNNGESEGHFQKASSSFLTDSPCTHQGMRPTERVLQIACGGLHTLIRTSENRIYATGDNSTSALGVEESSSLSSFTEIQLPSSSKTSIRDSITHVSCGLSHSGCIIGGKAFIWGKCSSAKPSSMTFKRPIPIECFDESDESSYKASPVKETIKDLQLGDHITILLTTKGSVYSIGDNNFGVLGTGNPSNSHVNEVPGKLSIPEEVSQVSLTAQHGIALTASRSVYVWGRNTQGQLGLSSFKEPFGNSPRLVDSLEDSSTVKVVAGGCFSLFVVHKSPNESKSPEDDSELEKVQSCVMTQMQEEIDSLRLSLKNVSSENSKLKKDFQSIKASKTGKDSSVQCNLQSSNSPNRNKNEQEVATYRKKSAPGRTVSPFFELEYKEITLEKQISEGGYGLIYRGRWRGSVVAIKLLKIEMMKEENIKDFLSTLLSTSRLN